MIPGVWRYTTIRCVKVWKYYTVWGPAMAAVAAIGCGGYVAGRPLPPAPMPYVAPFFEPAPLLIPAPDVAYAPPLWGYEPGVVGIPYPAPRTALGAPRQMPGPSAGGLAGPDENSVVPCCIQPHTTGHLYSPPVAVAVPAPPAWVLFVTALCVFVGLRTLMRPANAEPRGPIGLVSWALLCAPWPVAFWSLL